VQPNPGLSDLGLSLFPPTPGVLQAQRELENTQRRIVVQFCNAPDPAFVFLQRAPRVIGRFPPRRQGQGAERAR
jgi:hypothetical protein